MKVKLRGYALRTTTIHANLAVPEGLSLNLTQLQSLSCAKAGRGGGAPAEWSVRLCAAENLWPRSATLVHTCPARAGSTEFIITFSDHVLPQKVSSRSGLNTDLRSFFLAARGFEPHRKPKSSSPRSLSSGLRVCSAVLPAAAAVWRSRSSGVPQSWWISSSAIWWIPPNLPKRTSRVWRT